MRVCTVCKEGKDESVFSVIRRNLDGSVKYRNSWCSPCKTEKGRQKHGVTKRAVKVVTDTTRECTQCHEIKNNDCFAGRNSWCKSCINKAQLMKKGGRVKPLPQLFEDSKECLECHQIIPLSGFSPAIRGRLGKAAYCKPCSSARILSTAAYKAGKGTESTRRYREVNHERHKALHRIAQFNRKATVKAQSDGSVTDVFVKDVYSRTHCYWCKEFIEQRSRTLEHIIELSQGGLHSTSNIEMACRSCNSSRKGRSK